jgi:hypothetical protein
MNERKATTIWVTVGANETNKMYPFLEMPINGEWISVTKRKHHKSISLSLNLPSLLSYWIAFQTEWIFAAQIYVSNVFLFLPRYNSILNIIWYIRLNANTKGMRQAVEGLHGWNLPPLELLVDGFFIYYIVCVLSLPSVHIFIWIEISAIKKKKVQVLIGPSTPILARKKMQSLLAINKKLIFKRLSLFLLLWNLSIVASELYCIMPFIIWWFYFLSIFFLLCDLNQRPKR